MKTSGLETKRVGAVVAAGLISTVGLALASISLMYIAGLFGLSIAFASQIVAAISIGGLALAIVIGLLSGGIAGLVIATARWAITKWGEAIAAA